MVLHDGARRGCAFLTWVRAGDEPPPEETRRPNGDELTRAEARQQELLETTREHRQIRDDMPTIPTLKESCNFDEGRLRSTLIQVARGVHVLHQNSKLHGDLKPANLLVAPSGRAVILDFGLATSLTPDYLYETVELDSRCGTPAYMSPEQAEGEPLTEASDWYSVGVMLYEALAARAQVVQAPFSHGTIAARMSEYGDYVAYGPHTQLPK